MQDFENILKKVFCEKEENLVASLHKNLWIEAEVKLFSMKHELQLARTEIEILKSNRCTEGWAFHLISDCHVSSILSIEVHQVEDLLDVKSSSVGWTFEPKLM